MDTNRETQVLPILVATLSILAVAIAPALAKSSEKSSSKSAAAAAASVIKSTPAVQEAPKPGQHDSKPGPAWRTIGGTLKNVQGDTYTVEDYEGNQVKLYVGQGTKHIKQKKVGDTVRAEITRGAFANSIQ